MDTPPGEKPSVIRRILSPLLAGLLAALPLALTIAVLFWLVDFIHRFLGPGSAVGKMLQSIGLKFAASEIVAYPVGIVLALLLIYLLGLLVEAGLKNRWNALVGNIVNRVPLVRTIYNALTRLLRMFEQNEQSELKAMSTVLCHFGGKGGTAVLALMPSSDRIQMNGQAYYGVLIPTAPVPFGGAILYVPVDWVEPVDISFDGLVNVYMSMGATSADYLQKPQTTQHVSKEWPAAVAALAGAWADLPQSEEIRTGAGIDVEREPF